MSASHESSIPLISRHGDDIDDAELDEDIREEGPLLSNGSSKPSTKSRSRKRFRLPLSSHRFLYPALIVLGIIIVWAFFSLLSFLHFYKDTGAHDVFNSPPVIPNPRDVESDVTPFPADDNFANVQATLASRLQAIGMSADKPLSCPDLDEPALYMRLDFVKMHGPTLIGLNLYNSADVFPTLAHTLLETTRFLSAAKVHIAIYENGSHDNTTAGMAHLAAALTAVKAPHTIISDPTPTKWKDVDRIEQLSIYRNLLLKPLYQNTTRPFETVVYLNDVFVCPRDLVELMYQRVMQGAHATCGLDYRWKAGWLSWFGGDGPKFYDSWVTRSLTGNVLRSRMDIFSEARDGFLELFSESGDEAARDRFRAKLPVPVYSCWNGMIAMDARPFMGMKPDEAIVQGLPIKNSTTPLVFRGAKRAEGECATSECKILAKDFWQRGFDRWVLVPSVRSTYSRSLHSDPSLLVFTNTLDTYTHKPSPSTLRLFTNATASPPQAPVEKDLIDWHLWSKPEKVVCYPYHSKERSSPEWPWTAIWETEKIQY